MIKLHKKATLFTILFSAVTLAGFSIMYYKNKDKNSLIESELDTTIQINTPSTLKVTESNSSNKSRILPQYTSDNSLVANILLQRNILNQKPIYRLANLDLAAKDVLSAYNTSNSMPNSEEVTLILDANNLKTNGWKAIVADNLNSGMLSNDEEYKFLLSDEFLYFGMYNQNNRFSIVAMNIQSPSKAKEFKSDNSSNNSDAENERSSLASKLPELTFDIDDFYSKLNSIGSERTSPSFDINDYIPKSYNCYYVAVPYGAGLEKQCD